MASMCPFPGTGSAMSKWSTIAICWQWVILLFQWVVFWLLWGFFFLFVPPALRQVKRRKQVSSSGVLVAGVCMWSFQFGCTQRSHLPHILKQGEGCSPDLTLAQLLPFQKIHLGDATGTTVFTWENNLCNLMQNIAGRTVPLCTKVRVVCKMKTPLKCSHTSLFSAS